MRKEFPVQKWQKRPTAPVAYVLFDLFWDNGHDLTGKSVLQRRERLQGIIHSSSRNSSGGYLEKRGVELFQLAKEKCFEGPISKWQPSGGKKLLS
jgi:ATP-dependent DNA ligase